MRRRQFRFAEAKEPMEAEVVLDGTYGDYDDGDFLGAMLDFCDRVKAKVPKKLRMEIEDHIEVPMSGLGHDIVSEFADELNGFFKSGGFGWHPDGSDLLVWFPTIDRTRVGS